MTDQQPAALRLADELCAAPERSRTSFEAAAELRRLHALNAELLEALDNITHYAECNVAAFKSGRPYLDMTLFPSLCSAARAAIAKGEA